MLNSVTQDIHTDEAKGRDCSEKGYQWRRGCSQFDGGEWGMFGILQEVQDNEAGGRRGVAGKIVGGCRSEKIHYDTEILL